MHLSSFFFWKEGYQNLIFNDSSVEVKSIVVKLTPKRRRRFDENMIDTEDHLKIIQVAFKNSTQSLLSLAHVMHSKYK
jgi:hypothetical protein